MINELGFTPLFQFVTPSVVRGEMETINNLATQLAREIIASKALGEFKSNYASFYNEWLLFKANSSSWITLGLSATYEKTLNFKERLKDWQQKFIALGNRSQVEIATGAGVNSTFPYRSLAIGGGVALGLYFVLKAFLEHRE